MIYSIICPRCGWEGERKCPIEERNWPYPCHECGTEVTRAISNPQIMIPERFSKWSRKNLEPTYEECKAIDQRNEEYLRNKPPERKKKKLKEYVNDALIESGQRPVNA